VGAASARKEPRNKKKKVNRLQDSLSRKRWNGNQWNHEDKGQQSPDHRAKEKGRRLEIELHPKLWKKKVWLGAARGAPERFKKYKSRVKKTSTTVPYFKQCQNRKGQCQEKLRDQLG